MHYPLASKIGKLGEVARHPPRLVQRQHPRGVSVVIVIAGLEVGRATVPWRRSP